MCAQVANVITRERVDITDIVNAAAAAHDCPAMLLVACGIAESGLSAQAAREAAWPDVSYSIWQEAVKWAAAYGVGDGQDTPANRALVRNILSTDLTRAADIAARQLGQYWQRTHDPLQSLYLYNWPGGGGQPASAEAAQNYRRGWQAAQLYLAPDQEAAPMHYDPDTSPEYQQQGWSCSIRTATWLLRSIGIPAEAGDMQERMVAAGLVTPASGLLDGSGTALAQWLTATFGVRATARYPADWSEVVDYSGDIPIGLGGQTWDHWVAVRRHQDGANALEIMNPAPGWLGIGTTLTRDDWERLGPFAAIYLAVPEEDDLSADERAELEQYRQDQPYYDTLLGSKDNPGGLIGSALGTMEEATGTSKTHLAKVVREQVSAVRRAAGL